MKAKLRGKGNCLLTVYCFYFYFLILYGREGSFTYTTLFWRLEDGDDEDSS